MLLGVSTFAFAGVYLSTLIVPAILCILLLIACRPWPWATGASGWSAERWFTLALALVALQLLPLPGLLLDLVSLTRV